MEVKTNKKRKIEKCHVDLATTTTTTMTTTTTWADLDDNLLQKIFKLVHPLELLVTTSLVCHSWRASCWDALFWKDDNTLDLRKFNIFLNPRGRLCNSKLFLDALSCMMNSCHMVKDNASRRRIITKITIECGLLLRDNHLMYIAERSPELKSLILPYTRCFTARGMTSAIRNWRELEDIFIGPIYNHQIDFVIQELGNSCKSLNTFSISGSGTLSSTNFRLDEYNALVIAQYLRQVEVLTIKNTRIYKYGLNFVLQKCRQLSKLSLTDCRGVMDRPACLGAKRAIFINDNLSVEIRRSKEGKLTRWFIGTSKKLYTLKELIDHLWP